MTTLSKVILGISSYEKDLEPAAYKKLGGFNTMIQIILQNLTLQTPAQLIEELAKGLKYEERLIKQEGKDNAEERMGNIGQLINMAMKFTDVGVDATTQFLEEVSLMTSIEEASTEEAEAIKMMSVHGSKGLEFPYVFIV